MFFLLKPMEILLFYQNKKYKHSSFFICTFFLNQQGNYEIYFLLFLLFFLLKFKNRFVSWKAAFSLTSNIYQSLPDDWSPDLQTFPSKYDYDYISTFPQIYGRNIEIFIFPPAFEFHLTPTYTSYFLWTFNQWISFKY